MPVLRAINDYCNKIRLSVITDVHIINSYINRNYTQTQEVKAITPRTERRVTANCANWPVLYFMCFLKKIMTYQVSYTLCIVLKYIPW